MGLEAQKDGEPNIKYTKTGFLKGRIWNHLLKWREFKFPSNFFSGIVHLEQVAIGVNEKNRLVKMSLSE